jgi:hypothetical protein
MGFLIAGMYLTSTALAGASATILISVFLDTKKEELETVHTDPVTRAIEQFHNPKIADAIVGVYISSNEKFQDGERVERRILDQDTVLGKDLVDNSRLFHQRL